MVTRFGRVKRYDRDGVWALYAPVMVWYPSDEFPAKCLSYDKITKWPLVAIQDEDEVLFAGRVFLFEGGLSVAPHKVLEFREADLWIKD